MGSCCTKVYLIRHHKNQKKQQNQDLKEEENMKVQVKNKLENDILTYNKVNVMKDMKNKKNKNKVN